MNIYDLISRAQKLRKETQLDSVSPDRVGGLHEDTLKYINEFQLLASSPSLHKIYASVSAMQSDKSPKSDLTGKPLKPGQLVVIVPANQTDATAGDVYRYDGPSGNTSAWTFVAKIGAVPADAELSATSTNPPQNKVVTEKLTELESEVAATTSAFVFETSQVDYYINPANGKIQTTHYGFSVSDKIDVRNYRKFILTSKIDFNAVTGFLFTDESDAVISYGKMSAVKEMEFEVPNGAVYFQFSYVTDAEKTISLRLDTLSLLERMSYVEQKTEGNADYISIIDSSIGSLKNRFDGSFEAKKYINPANGLIQSTPYEYATSSKVDCRGAKSLTIASDESFNAIAGYIFLDASDNVISYGAMASANTMKLPIPSDAVALRISAPSTAFATTIISEDSIASIRQDVSTLQKISREKIVDKSNEASISLSGGENVWLTWGGTHNRTWNISAQIEFDSFSAFKVYMTGRYFENYGASEVTINDTDVIVHNISDNSIQTFQHGLIWKNSSFIFLDCKNSMVTITLSNEDGEFRKILPTFDGILGARISNEGASVLNVHNFRADHSHDINASVVLCGDSYAYPKFGETASDSTAESGYSYTRFLGKIVDFANISIPGGTSKEIYSSLGKYIDKGGKPNIIIWGLGMNDSYENYELYLPQASALAESIGAVFIPATIPTVPNRDKTQHTALAKTYARYVDFASALTDANGWKKGYLSSDNLHPSRAGFNAMKAQIMVDVPELFLNAI